MVKTGGRGSASGFGIRKKDNRVEYIKYGTEYRMLFQHGNIKFIEATSHDSELFETRTRGRVYVIVSPEGKLKSITYFDNNNKRSKVIDLTHKHDDKIPHVHWGYEHPPKEDRSRTTRLSIKEKEMVDRVRKLWDNYNSK